MGRQKKAVDIVNEGTVMSNVGWDVLWDAVGEFHSVAWGREAVQWQVQHIRVSGVQDISAGGSVVDDGSIDELRADDRVADGGVELELDIAGDGSTAPAQLMMFFIDIKWI